MKLKDFQALFSSRSSPFPQTHGHPIIKRHQLLLFPFSRCSSQVPFSIFLTMLFPLPGLLFLSYIPLIYQNIRDRHKNPSALGAWGRAFPDSFRLKECPSLNIPISDLCYYSIYHTDCLNLELCMCICVPPGQCAMRGTVLSPEL